MKSQTPLIATVILFFACCAAAAEPLKPADIAAETFAQLPRMSDVELSPDGSYVAYLQPFEGREHLIIQPLKTKQRLILPPIKTFDYDWIHWANDDRLVFAMSSFGKRWSYDTKETRLLSIDRKGEDLRWIIKAARDATSMRGGRKTPVAQIQDRVIDWLPDDPDHILVALDEDFDTQFEVRKIDVATGNYKIVRSGMRGVQQWITDQSGEIRFGQGFQNKKFVALLKDTDGNWNSITNTDWWDRGYRLLAFTTDPEIAYTIGPGEAGVDLLRTMHLTRGVFVDTIFESEQYDVDTLISDPITRKPAGARYIDDDVRVSYFDPVLDRLQGSLNNALPKKRNTIAGMSQDRMQVLVFSFSDTSPGDYYYWDRRTKTMDFIAESMPGLPDDLLSPTTTEQYESRDGTVIPAYLNIPLGQEAKNLPAVLLPHGGPHSRSDSGFSFLAQFIASRGYAVLQPNFRGSSGYGRKFERAGHNQWGGIMQDDVTDGAQWLIDQGIADPDRLCIVGWSYGGYAAAMGAVKTPDLYRCAVSINGVLNLPLMVDYEKDYIGGRALTGKIGLDGEKLKAVSPYHQAKKIEIPMLIIQARDDSTVQDNQAVGMSRRLRKLNKPVENITVDLGGHSLNNAEARLAILQSIEGFLQRHIGTTH